MTADWVLKRFASGEPVSARAVIVTAHPDDETVSMGGALTLLEEPTIVQLTDGAIDDPDAWARAGASTREEYRLLRERERAAALLLLETTARVVDLGVTDQETVHHLPMLIQRVIPNLVNADVVFTHPYEGGHVDHDSAAYVVQEACAQMERAPLRLEFASYHWDGRTRRAGAFWPVPEHDPIMALLDGDRLRRKTAAIAAYTTQASVTRWFPIGRELYRIAPVYDFSRPPTTPACWYDRKAWKITSAQWRAAVASQAVVA